MLTHAIAATRRAGTHSAFGLAVCCAIAASPAMTGCEAKKNEDTRFTLALAPDASCLASTSVDAVDHLTVTRLSESGAIEQTWEFPFDVNSPTAAPLGDLPNHGKGRFTAAGTGTICGIAATNIFEGTSNSVTFDPDGDQHVVVPVTCPTLSPCGEPVATPTPFASYSAANKLLGQPDMVTCNGGAFGTGRTFREPAGLEIANDTLWIADRGFNRIAAFTPLATINSGMQLSFAVGQGDTNGNGTGTDDNDLDHPLSILALSDRIAVMDGNNNRGQITTPIPTASGAIAGFALGQNDADNDATANAGGTTAADTLDNPAGSIVAGGYVYVADADNHRVLRYPVTALAGNRPPADIVLGQADFTGNQANRGATAAADTLSAPTHVATDGTRLWIADTGNNRVVGYDLAGIATGASASIVITVAGGVNLSGPRGVSASADRLVVADSNNNRVLIWQPLPATASDAPSAVLGQMDLTTVDPNLGGDNGPCPNQETCTNPGRHPTAQSLSRPDAVLLRGDELWVSDACNARVLRFTPPTR